MRGRKTYLHTPLDIFLVALGKIKEQNNIRFVLSIPYVFFKNYNLSNIRYLSTYYRNYGNISPGDELHWLILVNHDHIEYMKYY